MKEFILDYWQLLLVGLLAIVEICLLIFKKPIKIETIKEEILRVLPFYIAIAEKVFTQSGSGNLKIEFVLSSIKELLKLDGSLDSFIRESAEAILSTPAKKGIIKNEK